MNDTELVRRLRDCTCIPHGEICREAADEIERLRKERDEARRLVCRHTKKTYRTLRETAEERGWDCFAVRSEP